MLPLYHSLNVITNVVDRASKIHVLEKKDKSINIFSTTILFINIQVQFHKQRSSYSQLLI